MKKINLALFLLLLTSFSFVLADESSCDGYNNCLLYEDQNLIVDGLKISVGYLHGDQVRLIVGGIYSPTFREGESIDLSNGYHLRISDITYDSRENYDSSVAFSLTRTDRNSYCDNEGECLLYKGQAVYFGEKKVTIYAVDEDSVRLRIGEELTTDLFSKGTESTESYNLLINEIRYEEGEGAIVRVSFTIEDPSSRGSGYYCLDSDNGIDYSVRGQTTLNSESRKVVKEVWDTCASEQSLVEYYCEANTISQKEYICPGACNEGVCGEKQEKNNNGEEIVSLLEGEESCDVGCFYKEKCYPYLYRVDGKYCQEESQEFIEQKAFGQECSINEECFSGLCKNEKCISEGLIQKFVKWVAGLFD